ncbi:ethanolamine ammonia-lyase subunit EutB [Spirosoma fluminis]
MNEAVVLYKQDEVTRLSIDTHDGQAFALIRHLTVGDFRNFLLSAETDRRTLQRLASGLLPEVVAAVSKATWIRC